MSLVAADDGGVSEILAESPRWVAFWSLLAIPLYTSVAIGLAALISPDVKEVMTNPTPDTSRLYWLIFVTAQTGVLIHLIWWCESKGIGPIAGPVRIPAGWAPAIMLAPVLFLSIQLGLTELVAQGNENWQFGEDGPPETLKASAVGISFAIAVVLLAPLFEEITMRGIAMGFMLGRGVSPWIAILISSAVFTVFHQQYTLLALVPIFVMGCYFGWLRVKTGTVMVPLLAHFLSNGFVMLIQVLSIRSGVPAG